MRFSLGTILALAALVLSGLSPVPARAADPQPYRVDMMSTGDSDIDSTLKASSELMTLRTSAPVSPFGLIGRARSDLERLKTVLESFGHYQSYVEIRVDGLPLDAPTLAEELTARASGSEAQVRIIFSLGRLYHLRHIQIDGEVPKSAQDALGLQTGDVAIASDVLAAGDRLQTRLEDQGYAFAKVDPPVAYEDPDNCVLDVVFHVVTGAPAQIGEIRIRGLKRVKDSFVRRRLLVHTGEQFGSSKIERARKDLLGLGVFSAVTVAVGTAADSLGRVPVTFRMRERPEHAVRLSGAYSTDLGGSTGVSWMSRNVSGKADQLTLAASVINLGGSATTGIGYDVNGKYIVPEFGHRDQALQVGVGALKQSLQAYDQQALTFGIALNRKLSRIWSASVGVSAEREHIVQQECDASQNCLLIDQTCVPQPPPPLQSPCISQSFHYTLFSLPVSVTYNTTGLDSPLEDARHGIRASLSLAPTLSIGRPNAKFLITQANLSTYFDLNDWGLTQKPGRSVLALRALAGLAAGASEFSLPPDQRFYAGGAGTVRGFRYQSVGPQFADGNPIGGTAINAGSIEFRQRFGKSLGAAFFVDAGQVSANLNPLAGTLRFGTGAGVRYYTPIGPIRLDVAVPINRRPRTATTEGDDPFEIYIGLGQSF